MTPDIGKLRGELRKVALTGWDSYVCCIRARNSASRLVSGTADLIQTLAVNANLAVGFLEGSTLVAPVPIRAPIGLPGALPTPVVFPVPFTDLDVLGFVDPEVGKVISVFDPRAPNPQAVPFAIAILKAVATQLRETAPDDCAKCIRAKKLGQGKPRMRFRARSRGGLEERLLLRVPHD